MSGDYRHTKFSFSNIGNLLGNTKKVNAILLREKKLLSLGLLFIVLFLAVQPFVLSGIEGLLINELVRFSTSGETTDSYLIILIIALVLGGAMVPFLFAIQSYLIRVIHFFADEKYELLLLRKKTELDVSVLENPEKSDLFNKIKENGIWRVQNFMGRQYFILQNIIEVFIASAIILFFQWWLFLIIFIASIPQFLIEIKYGKQIWSIHGTTAEKRRRYWDLEWHFNFLPPLIELKLFQNSKYFFSLIRDLLLSFHAEEKKNDKRNLGLQCIAILLNQAAIAFAVVWFVFMVIQGQLEIGTFIFVLASINNLIQSFSSFFRNIADQYQDSLFVSDLFKALDLKSEIIQPLHGIKLNPTQTPEIVFDKVSFAYPNTNTLIFSNFSLKISPGEKIALIGVNGAGKTTFVKLLCRFYDPTQGRILIDGHDLKDIDLDSWYNLLGALFQDYSHYNLLIKDAIAVGRTAVDFNFERVKQAAKASEADVFIEKFDKQYDQVLGKQFTGGVEPSIGQWQKLALARTFYRDPRVYILDEPTASIDAESEAKIFEKLEALPRDRTVFLISHRFSTVRKADKIVVLELGEIKEMGTHQELMDLDGTYAQLFNLQAKGYR